MDVSSLFNPNLFSTDFNLHKVPGLKLVINIGAQRLEFEVVGQNQSRRSPLLSASDIKLQQEKGIPMKCPDVSSALDRAKMTWMAVNITYHLDFPYIGQDNLTCVVTDKNSTRSDIVTLQIAPMAQPCLHNGGCKSKHPDRYECEDIRRTESFDPYYTCDCHGGWTGLRCEDDIDECVGNPCAKPLICLNLQKHFQCACPPNQTNCLSHSTSEDGFKWWMGALIAVGCLLLIGIVVVCFLYKAGHLMEWKRGANNVMAKIKNGSKVSIMSHEFDDSVGKSEERVKENEEDKEESIDVEEENGHTSVLEVSGVDINADTPKLDFSLHLGYSAHCITGSRLGPLTPE